MEPNNRYKTIKIEFHTLPELDKKLNEKSKCGWDVLSMGQIVEFAPGFNIPNYSIVTFKSKGYEIK